MKRTLFLICVLLLLADLADDGYLGKAPVLGPPCPGKISFSSSPDNSGTILPQVWIAATEASSILRGRLSQLTLLEAYDAPAILHPHLCSSSGGLPL